MEPEDLGPFVLRYFDAQQRNGTLSRTNFGLVQDVPRSILERLMEGWMFLEREGFIAPDPSDRTGLWYFITRRGQSIKPDEDFKAYRHAAIFPNDLDAILMRTVKPLFVRGDYDTAVFRAFKEHEWCSAQPLPRAGLNMPRNRRVPFAIWVTLWAIIVVAALALIITVVAWFAIP
jgi:hypothetical protein